MCANRLASRWAAFLTAALATVILADGASTLRAEGKKAPTQQPAATAPYTAVATTAKAEPAPDGAELFAREWLPNDSRAHGGDGLGPVFNDSSCVACHNQGGVGGAGPASKNVDIITAFPLSGFRGNFSISEPRTLPQSLFDLAFGSLAPAQSAVQGKPNTSPKAAHAPTAHEIKLAKEQERHQLMQIHPGFGSGRSVVLHHFGTDPKYQEWRSRIASGQFNVTFVDRRILNSRETSEVAFASNAAPLPQFAASARSVSLESNPEVVALQNDVRMKHSGLINTTIQTGNVQISHSQRNPIALFGIGLIDAIPEQAIIDLAKTEQEQYPDVAGRPAKQKNGKIGRFGWKDQKPSLEDFALTACAIELGLNVPGHQQAGVPLNPNYKAPGLDMNKAECDAMVSYLRNLPAPIERKPATAQEAASISAGHKLFATVGCAACHVEKVGSTVGVYSDLLLHDMGAELGDEGDYDIFTPDAPEEDQDVAVQPAAGQANRNLVDAGPGIAVPAIPGRMSPQQKSKLVGALRQEWRTAPLWGIRDSGPYLHDGRADTLEQAIAFHGGQGATAATKFFQLKAEERAEIITFLKSLTAPEPAPKTVKLAAQ